MAIPNLPFWLSEANREYMGRYDGWISEPLAAAGIPAPRWCSDLAGRSKEIRVDITWGDHDFNTNNLHTWMLNAAGGAWPGDHAVWRIVVHGGMQLVSYSKDQPCMWFGGAIRGRVIIENHGWIWGRGGNGGYVSGGHESGAVDGTPGGIAIYREGHITLEIINYGIISGGGGGGGAAYTFSSAGGGRHYGMGGGGGRPFGAGGWTSGMNHPRPGGAASIDGPGGPGVGGDAGNHSGGWGGDIGAWGGNGNGNKASRAGGAPGGGISGGGPIAMTVQGDIRGGIAW